MPYVLRIKPENEEIKKFYDNHGKFNEGDDGLDLFVPEDITIPGNNPDKSYSIDHKIRCEMFGMIPVPVSATLIATPGQEGGYVLRPYNVGYYLMPRSSISDTPLQMANSIGLIDKSYRGNIIAKVRNLSNEDYVVKKGTRLFQITSKDADDFNFVVVGELTDTKRGTGGFGSTGK